MEELIGLVVGCGTSLVALVLLVGIINWPLGPIMRRLNSTAATRRFLLSDLCWLLIYLQVAMGVAVATFPAELPTAHRVGAMVLLCVAVTIFWLAAVLAASEAKVRRLARRAVVFLVLVPGTVAVIVGLPLLLLGLSAPPYARGESLYLREPAVLLFAMAGWMTGLRWLAAWSVESPHPWREAFALERLQSMLPRRDDQGPYRPVWPRRPGD